MRRHACSVRAGASFYKINGLSADEFPPIQTFKEDKKITLPQEKFKGMLRKTSFAISTDESRYVLNGIFISLKEHKMTMVATDGRRLALVDEEVDIPENSQGEFIIPTKAVNELNRLLGEKGDVEIGFEREPGRPSRSTTTKAFPSCCFPSWWRAIIPITGRSFPAKPRSGSPCRGRNFWPRSRRAQIMTSDKANSVKMAVSRNNLAITANSPEVGEARESLAINYKGKEMAIAFNPAYLIEPLSALTEDEVFLELIDELSPGVLKINGPFLYVVMPMRLS